MNNRPPAPRRLSAILSQDKASYQIRSEIVVERMNCDNVHKLILILPTPHESPYQRLDELQIDEGGESWGVQHTEDSYVRFTLSANDLRQQPDTIRLGYTANVCLRSVQADFGKMQEEHEYDYESLNYNRHIEAVEGWLQLNLVQERAEEFWAQNGGGIPQFAELCARYIAENFRYLNPHTGLHKLETILENGGGDCGNLSSIFVAMMRSRGIPARHVVGFSPTKKYHVWAEFYMERYGWVPVDVDAMRTGGEFGLSKGEYLVVSQEVGKTVMRDDNTPYATALLQSYYWWYWWRDGNGCKTIKSHHHVSAQRL